jgi:outer membrane receptor protein involved in Fe transport
MRKSYSFLAALLMACLFSVSAYAQSVTITGTVKNSTSKENVPAVSIVVKGTSQGTYTDAEGVFSMKVAKLPVVLVISSAGGYTTQEVIVTDASKPVEISFVLTNVLGDEVVVAATRAPQRILDAPVTVERMSSAAIRNLPAPSAYEGIGNLKGVDVHTASLTFRTVTTRGFVSSGNTRLNQLVDGMDNQAPGLNFAVSSIVGLTDLDVDNIEVLAGASSALYGSGGMNGTVLITSKSPFKYKGFSYNVKQGIMHVDKKQHAAAPYNNIAMRYAAVFKNKLAFRISGELIRGSDWEAEDYRNKQQIGILSKVAGGNRYNDPNFNGVNVYGDETSVNMNQLALALLSSIQAQVLSLSGNTVNLINNANANFGANPYPTNAQVAAFIAGLPAPFQPAAQLFAPMYIGYSRNYFGAQTNVTRTGYNEDQLVDYNTLNVKMNAGLYYKINDRIEASVNSYFGTGTTVYTGANRYSLRGFKMAQHKFEVKAKNWMYRAYTIQENAGDSYIGDALGAFINEAWKPSVNTANLPGSWFPQYLITFSEGRRTSNGAASDAQLHLAGRNTAEVGRFLPGTQQFNDAARTIKTTAVNKPGGAKFLDKSDLYSMEANLNISMLWVFQYCGIGLNWKQWVLKNSQGTIFADTLNAIRINEYGGFIQLKKKLLNDALTLTASGRYDKQKNFDGKFTPRVTAVIRVARDNNVRLSYQTAYRFPSNQNQYISLRLGGGSSFLIGSLPEFQTFYKLNGARPGYTAASIISYRAGSPADSSRLVQASFSQLKPETVASYEIGYKGIIGKKLLVDAYYYCSNYKDFIVSVAVGQAQADNAGKLPMYSPFSTNNVSYNQNSCYR